ncbi:MAG: DUF1844 domain-containing protein [Acidobacteria bacterium]|nr:DUF1844 domain-containing protein [Acidobacteriota bacterium]MBI3656961.1 DUF1844 domain-containing protein [Acidobacteriota bacterium]
MGEQYKPEGFTIRDRRSRSDASSSPETSSPDTQETLTPEEKREIGDAPRSAAAATGAAEQHLHEVTFATFILSLSTSAVVSLGEIPDPSMGKLAINLEHAKQIIDILGIIKNKTLGNLQKEEEALLNGLLYDLRMKYLQKINPVKL